MNQNEPQPYQNDFEKNQDFIPLHELRENPQNSKTLYPHCETAHFPNPTWDEKLQTSWDHGTNWYQHFTDKGQIKHLYHKSNNENRTGENFHNTPDIITGGCSITTPLGIPHNFGWPEIIRHTTNQTINNVSHASASTSRIVYNIFHHMQKYGQPKKIYILLPELTRGWITQKTEHKNQNAWQTREIIYYTDQKNYVLKGKEYKINKLTPYIHQSFDGHKTLIPLDIIIEESLKSLEILKMHCNISNIELKLFSWDQNTDHMMKKTGYQSYTQPPQHLLNRPRPPTYPNPINWTWPPRIEPFGRGQHCCNLQPQNKHQQLMWDNGLDGNPPQHKWPHPGLHPQLHLAEIFLQTKLTENDYKNLKPWYANTHLDTL